MDGGERKGGSPTYLHAVGRRKEKCNITPFLGSTSVAMLVLLHQETKLTPVNYLNPLEDSGSSHVMSTSPQG